MWAGTSETESAFPWKLRENARPPSWFSSEIGTKADAKQSLRAFVRFWGDFLLQSAEGPEDDTRLRF
jgi:hypothetical protein